MNENRIKKVGADISIDIIGGLLIAFGAYNFAASASFPMVGINGIALIFYYLFKLPIGTMAIILNIPIAIMCYKILGRDFFLRSVRTIIITSIIMDYVAPLFPMYTGDRLLAAICSGALSGMGYALIYLRDTSTGGADFIMMSIKAKKPHISLGKIAFIMDISVVLLGTIFAKLDVDSLIYGIILSFILSQVMDKIMYIGDDGKVSLIITEHPKEVAGRIDELVERGATYLKAEGSYQKEEKKIVMCACSNKEMHIIKTAVKEIDHDAFMIILDTHEVYGEGFKLEVK